MGFHYTEQYSRRTRIKVMGLVNHASPQWREWYLGCHELPALQKMKEQGYDFLEIHFIYGYGLKGESVEIERTRQMAANAHQAGFKIIGYFQFFSVQEELFFIENPWAKNCLQLDPSGKRREYNYDRPALCFSHEKVRQYYLDGIETGLKYCDLDGIRLDNDYYKGCWCEKCRALFHEYLTEKYSPDQAEHMFGIRDLSNLSIPERQRAMDPAWLEINRFRQRQRQEMMRLFRQKIDRLKPGAILGGNPAVSRKTDTDITCSFYPADLGETHDLVCAENNLFPRYTGKNLVNQAEIYKFGEAAGFKVFPSHHIYNPEGKLCWPDTEGCALTLAEALALGGNAPCTTWGLRMDGDRSLYERPEFLKATNSFADFIHRYSFIWENATNHAITGIYLNRESRIMFSREAQVSLWGILQILLKNGIPFRFIPFDGAEHLAGIETLIVPNIPVISGKQLDLIRQVPNLIMTGQSGRYDEHLYERGNMPVNPTPEAVEYQDSQKIDEIDYPPHGDEILARLNPEIRIKGGTAVAANLTVNRHGEFLHLLNYDNRNPVDLEICGRSIKEIYSPDIFGCDGFTENTIQKLHTYCIVRLTF